MYVVSSMRAYLCNTLLTWHFFPDSVSPQLVLQFLLLIGVDYTVTAVGTVLTWLCCMVSWFPVGLLHDAKRLQRQWFPGRSASYRYHSTACSFFHLPRDFMESLASLVSGWGLSRGWGNVGRVEGSGNWICVYLQRICAVAGKWTYNLTCLTNAFKRFSSYFPQHRDQSCRLFSPPLCLSLPLRTVIRRLGGILFRIPFQLALHFLFAFRFASRLIPFSDLICNLIVIDIRVRVQKRFTSEWVKERWGYFRYSTQLGQLSTGDWQWLTGIRHARPSGVVWPMAIGNAIVN